MESAQFKQSLMTLHWSTVTLADILRCPTDVVMAWYYGHVPVPAAVGDWLGLLVAAHQHNPPPIGVASPEALEEP